MIEFTVKFFHGTDLRHKSVILSLTPVDALSKALAEVGGTWGPGIGFRIEIA